MIGFPFSNSDVTGGLAVWESYCVGIFSMFIWEGFSRCRTDAAEMERALSKYALYLSCSNSWDFTPIRKCVV